MLVAAELVVGAVTHLDELMAWHGLPAPGASNATIAMAYEAATTLMMLLRRPKTLTYVEWGSGGSTELVAWLLAIGQLPSSFLAVSIESSTEVRGSIHTRTRIHNTATTHPRPHAPTPRQWMRYMRERSPLVRRAETNGQLTFRHGDLGATGHLGYPKNFDRQPTRAVPYVELDDKLEGRKADLVLVDGRFRLACMLEAFDHLRRNHTRHQPVVLLHDYTTTPSCFAKRHAEYGRALAFYNLLAINATLATLIPKPNLLPAELRALRKQKKDALQLPD